jgi:hypothetical protein
MIKSVSEIEPLKKKRNHGSHISHFQHHIGHYKLQEETWRDTEYYTTMA